MKKYLISIIILILFVSNSIASDGVSFKIDIYQIEKPAEKKYLIYSNSFDIVVGKSITGFVGPFSLDIELLTADSTRTTFNTHIITLGTLAKTYSKSFSVEYELPALIEKIEGKNNTEYLLMISPLSHKPEIEIYCQIDHRVKDDFTVKPTANTDLYYVPSTLGDFYWDSVKELMESNYILFRNFLHLNIPGKINIYIPPCAIHSVIWDKRFGTSVDPTKSTAYAVYGKDFSTVDPFIINHTAALKTYGYSAPFLSEGLANYFSFAIFEMKKIVKEKRNIKLENLLETYAYTEADASIADRISTTFSRFLIDRYSLSSFLELYKKSDDINLAATLQEVYKKPIAELEQEWLFYVDTFTIKPKSYNLFARSSEMMLKYDLMHRYYNGYLEAAVSKNDSLVAFKNLKRSSFFNGDYNEALTFQQNFMDLKPQLKAIDWMVLGSYALMIGEDDKAIASYTKALEIDSTNNLVKFNIALYYHNMGEFEKAKEILLTNFSAIKGASAQGESRILLAEILSESKEKSDIESADKLYKEAVNYYTRVSQTNSSSPSAYMWLGKASLGIKDYEKAANNLLIANFIESRPFYIGMIDLLLGKTYIAMADKKLAEQYLNSVISNASAVYHQKEAKELLEQLNK